MGVYGLIMTMAAGKGATETETASTAEAATLGGGDTSSGGGGTIGTTMTAMTGNKDYVAGRASCWMTATGMMKTIRTTRTADNNQCRLEGGHQWRC